MTIGTVLSMTRRRLAYASSSAIVASLDSIASAKRKHFVRHTHTYVTCQKEINGYTIKYTSRAQVDYIYQKGTHGANW
jgi:hypothetical protein